MLKKLTLGACALALGLGMFQAQADDGALYGPKAPKGSAFVRAYLRTAGSASFLPRNDSDLELLLNSFLLEKSVYELGYELNNRPDWVPIPIRGIRELIA